MRVRICVCGIATGCNRNCTDTACTCLGKGHGAAGPCPCYPCTAVKNRQATTQPAWVLPRIAVPLLPWKYSVLTVPRNDFGVPRRADTQLRGTSLARYNAVFCNIFIGKSGTMQTKGTEYLVEGRQTLNLLRGLWPRDRYRNDLMIREVLECALLSKRPRN